MGKWPSRSDATLITVAIPQPPPHSRNPGRVGPGATSLRSTATYLRDRHCISSTAIRTGNPDTLDIAVLAPRKLAYLPPTGTVERDIHATPSQENTILVTMITTLEPAVGSIGYPDVRPRGRRHRRGYYRRCRRQHPPPPPPRMSSGTVPAAVLRGRETSRAHRSDARAPDAGGRPRCREAGRRDGRTEGRPGAGRKRANVE